MPLSDRTKKRVSQLISDHHKALAVEVIGPNAVSPEELKRLQDEGILHQFTAATKRESVAVPAAHVMGTIAAQSEDNLREMSEETFWNYIAHAPPRMTGAEMEGIRATRENIGAMIQNAGADFNREFEHACREEGTKRRRAGLIERTIRSEVSEGLDRDRSKSAIVARLRNRFPKAKRDWQLLVTTEMHNQLEEGKASAIVAQYPAGTDPRVYKMPRNDACQFCKLLYLDGKRPRIFKLSELIANGTNQGRRARKPVLQGPNATEWLATLGVVHPWCQCTLHAIPEGFAFDKNGTMRLAKSIGVDDAVVDELTPELRTLLAHACEQ